MNTDWQELYQIIKQENLKTKTERDLKVKKKLNQLYNGRNFRLNIIFLNVQNNGLMYDEIELEGFKNATDIFESYRKIGHNLKIYSMTLFLDDKKVKRLKFTY